MSPQPNMERFLRDWRQDALNKAQYDSAIFIGDKLLAMTSTVPPAAPFPQNARR
jgi:anaphase-promoting complex subunit 6